MASRAGDDPLEASPVAERSGWAGLSPDFVERVVAWTGGEQQALAWFRTEPIPAFGGRTADSMVKDGKAAAVRDYLDNVAAGGFA